MGTSRYDQAVELLGAEIVHGRRQPGEVFTTAQIEESLGLSRSVAREALRTLQVLGLVRPSTKVGSTVQPPELWNILAPQVIAWRMSGPDRMAQLRVLVELRAGIEPQAAALGARRANASQARQLADSAARMYELGVQGKGASPEFLAQDVTFHSTLLTATSNAAFIALAPTLVAVLESRNAAGLTPASPDNGNLQRHIELADAVNRRDEQGAAATARALLDTVADEVGGGISSA